MDCQELLWGLTRQHSIEAKEGSMDGEFKELRIGCYTIIICRKNNWVMTGNGNSGA